MEWILASASPRRKQLFKRIVRRFEVIPAKGEEKAEDWESPSELVMALAEQKAKAAKRIAEKFSLPFISLQDKFDAVYNPDFPDYWLRDGVHPTAPGHMLIAREWVKAFEEMRKQ